MNIQAISLEKTDFQDFDAVPDGVLRYAELRNSGQLELFIRRFLNTRSEEVASQFFFAMDYPLKKTIREKLENITRASEQNQDWSPDDLQHFKSWLNHWFVEQHFGVNFNTEYNFSSNQAVSNYSVRENDVWIGYEYQNSQSLNYWGNRLGGYGDYSWEGMKFSGNLDFSFDPQFGAASTRSVSAASDQGGYNHSETTPRRFGWAPSLSIRQEEEKYSFSVSGNFERVEDPLPESLAASNGVSGQVALRHPFDWPFDMDGGVSWSRQASSKSLGPHRGARTTESLPVWCTATFQFKETLGVVGEYYYNRARSVSAIDENFFSSQEGTILAQIKTGSESHIRAGVGSGLQENEFQMNQGGIYQHFQTAEIHSKASWKWNLNDAFSLETLGKGTAKYSEGTLNGWFPGVNLRENAEWSMTHWSLNFSLGWSAFWRDVDYRPSGPSAEASAEKKYTESHSFDSSAGVFYHPNEVWSSNFSLTYGLTRETGFQSGDSDNINANGSISTRLFLEPIPTWFLISGSYFWNDSFFEYDPPSGYFSSQFSVRGGMSMRY